MKQSPSNINLLQRLKEGDIGAFDTIYEHYAYKLHAFAIKFLKQEEDAAGIVQEVFLKIWESREKINASSTFEAYLFTITYNTTISLLRKKISESKAKALLKNLQDIEEPSIIDQMQFDELNAKYIALLSRLTPHQEKIFRMSREEGLSHKQIAQKLNISENTVKNHMVSILKFLKSNLIDNNNRPMSLLFVMLFLS